MARGRPRKKKITYDSKESKTVYGLLSFVAAAIFLLAFFVGDTPLLEFINKVFAETTFFAALFFVNLGLFFFNKNWKMSTGWSLFAQIIFTLSLATFLNSFIKEWEADAIANEGRSGGLLGLIIRDQLVPLVGLSLLQIILLILMFFMVPISFSMSLNEFFNMLDRIFKKIGEWIKGAIPDKKALEQKLDGENQAEGKKATMFSDFRDKNQVQNQVSEGPDTNISREESGIKPQVSIKEVSSGDGAFVNEELQYPDWKLPPTDLLNPFTKFKPAQEDIKRNSDIVEQTLNSFGVQAKVVDVLVGPTVSQYALDIALGTKVSKIQNLSNDLALALAVSSNSIRIEAPIPGTSYVGIEIPNSNRQFINFHEIVDGSSFKNIKDSLPVAVGKDLKGNDVISNIQKMPHLLIAGATGSGKSILTNTFIMSLLMKKSPDEVKFILVDPKQVELSDYNGIPHLLTPVITDMSKVLNALKWALAEMESRYTMFRENKVRNLEGYNELKGFSALPYIVVVIDEMADMMMTGGAEIEGCIVRLAQKARATGIHLLLATQRPSVDVITGLLKANIPGRIGLSVATQIDSRVILDQIGAEALLGKGDLLLKEPDKNKPFRVQGVWTAPEEIQRVVNFIKEQVPEVEYTKEVIQGVADPSLSEGAKQSASFSDDELFADAVRVVVQSQKGSSSLLQRKLSIGYNRAARLVDELYKYGVVGAEKGSKPREVLISDAETFLAGASADEEDSGTY
ncbi:MAG TPA: DNA translocase FtsK [Candidatus Dojkabacteria bacterium]|jgi:S-DNA-T family DNA segregation ATPase FtsK/SpoIIIE